MQLVLPSDFPQHTPFLLEFDGFNISKESTRIRNAENRDKRNSIIETFDT